MNLLTAIASREKFAEFPEDVSPAGLEFRRLAVNRLLVVIVLLLISTTGASAQTTTFPGKPQTTSAFDPDPIIRITTVFRARIEVGADPRNVPTAVAQDGARRTIYNMAANECTVLAEFWKAAECRLNSLALCIYSPCLYDAALANVDGRDLQPQIPSVFGTAVYELRQTALPGR